MPDYVVRRAQALLNDNGRAVKGSRILLIGLAYKAGTSDWRESPATIVAQRLSELGAEVRAHDAHVPDAAGLGPEVQRVDCTIEELEAADLVVVLTAHEDLPYDRSPTMRDSYWTLAVASAVARSGVKFSENACQKPAVGTICPKPPEGGGQGLGRHCESGISRWTPSASRGTGNRRRRRRPLGTFAPGLRPQRVDHGVHRVLQR